MRSVPIDRLEIGRRRRDLHEITRRVVVGACTPDAEIRAGGSDQRLGAWLNLTWRRRDNRRRNLVGKPSHWSMLKTVKRLRNGTAPGSSPASAARRRSSSGVKRSA